MFTAKLFHKLEYATGYGIENILKDEIAKKMIDSIMIPRFIKDEIYNGLYNGSKSIVELLENPVNEIK